MEQNNKRTKPVFSLQLLLVGIVLLCWVVPFSVILLYSSISVSRNVQGRIEDTIENSANLAFEQIYENLHRAMDSSRAPNYDGVIRTSWLQYASDNDEIKLYDDISSYLSQKYSYDDNFLTTYVFFTEETDKVYFANHHTNYSSALSLRYYLDNVHEDVLQNFPLLDTKIRFFQINDKLFMMRNIIDMRNIISKSLDPYAVIIMECDPHYLFESVSNIIWLSEAIIRINDMEMRLFGTENQSEQEYSNIMTKDPMSGKYLQRLTKSEYDFRIELDMASDATDLISQFSDNRNIMLLFAIFAFPLLLFSLFIFYKHVTLPTDRLVAATTKIEKGNRGYQVKQMPGNKEFFCLTKQFNSMSIQLEHQFNKIYEEQLALQEARIRALRSQINPHFLNNTLEIINWEAKLANNKKVSEMIDALAIMLGAATARSDNAMVDLREELDYVDAYLHIIKKRFGERLTVSKEVDNTLLSYSVPSLILQPIIENAVEHGISHIPKGEIIIKAYSEPSYIILEVENDGILTAEDKQKLTDLISGNSDASNVGIKNVSQRLKIIYGSSSEFSVEEIRPNRIMARLKIPQSNT